MKVPPTNPQGTILSWANAIAQTLEMQGIKSREIFEQVGIPYHSTVDPTYRVESDKITALFKLAVEDRLRDPQVSHAQVERMLADPRSSEFVNRFTWSWLKLQSDPRWQCPLFWKL